MSRNSGLVPVKAFLLQWWGLECIASLWASWEHQHCHKPCLIANGSTGFINDYLIEHTPKQGAVLYIAGLQSPRAAVTLVCNASMNLFDHEHTKDLFACSGCLFSASMEAQLMVSPAVDLPTLWVDSWVH